MDAKSPLRVLGQNEGSALTTYTLRQNTNPSLSILYVGLFWKKGSRRSFFKKTIFGCFLLFRRENKTRAQRVKELAKATEWDIMVCLVSV